VDWYKYNINDIKKEEYDRFFALMEEKKRERISRFKNIDDKKRSVCAEMLVKRAISEKCGIKIDEIVIETEDGGKPFCRNAKLQFSISHSGDYAVCAVSEYPIGIDIQKIVPYNPKTAKRVCTAAEFCEIEKSTVKDAEFIKIWTKKEAVMKMCGAGIAGADIKNCLFGKDVITIQFSDYFVSICEEKNTDS